MMPAKAARLALPVRRKDALARNAGLSVLLHLLLLAAFLARPHPGSLTQAAGPISVEIVPDVGSSDGQKLPAPSFAPAIVAPSETPATEPPPPAFVPPLPVPQADVPATSMPTPPSPTPSPTPPAAPAPSATEAPPAAESPPTAAATLVPAPEAAPPPPPAPAPAPAPAPQRLALAPPLPPTPVRPPRAAPRPPVRQAPREPSFPAAIPFASIPFTPAPRASPNHTSNSHGALDLSLGPEALNSMGAPPHTSKGMDADIRVEGAQVGNDWMAQLHEWWDHHAFYPQQAIINEEDGVVEIHMVITRDGHVQSVEVVSSSGSRWIDMAGVSVFRDAHLRPFPLSTPEPKADVYAYLHYILVHG